MSEVTDAAPSVAPTVDLDAPVVEVLPGRLEAGAALLMDLAPKIRGDNQDAPVALRMMADEMRASAMVMRELCRQRVKP